MNETIQEIIFFALKKNGLPETTAQALANYKFMEDAYKRIQKRLTEKLYKELYEEAMRFIVASSKI